MAVRPLIAPWTAKAKAQREFRFRVMLASFIRIGDPRLDDLSREQSRVRLESMLHPRGLHFGPHC